MNSENVHDALKMLARNLEMFAGTMRPTDREAHIARILLGASSSLDQLAAERAAFDAAIRDAISFLDPNGGGEEVDAYRALEALRSASELISPPARAPRLSPIQLTAAQVRDEINTSFVGRRFQRVVVAADNRGPIALLEFLAAPSIWIRGRDLQMGTGLGGPPSTTAGTG